MSPRARIALLALGAGLLLPATVLASRDDPEVRLVEPDRGERRFVAPATVVLEAKAQAARGRRIARVEFFADGKPIGHTSTAPYEMTWRNVALGHYSVRAKATDNRGASDWSPPIAVHVHRNHEPHVTLLEPDRGDKFKAPATIRFEVRARDGDHNLARVEFYANGELVGQATRAPWRFTWSAVQAGDYLLHARAIDAHGAADESRKVPIRVIGNAPPTVSLGSPANGATFTAPAAIPLAANASSPGGAGGGGVARVEFYANDILVATDFAAPYAATWNGAAPGNYTLRARAVDTAGTEAFSAPVSITVVGNLPPVVTLTSPAAGATFTAPAAITLAANASDTTGPGGGGVVRIEFYANDTLVAIDLTDPYAVTWSGAAPGTYTLRARAVDTAGAETFSAPVSIAVIARELEGYFIHVDYLNTPRLITNQTGQAVWSRPHREPFGDSPPDENPSGLGTFEFPLRDAGTYSDRETNLLYNWNRYRDLSLGRFIQADPLGLNGGDPSLYGLRKNNPLTYTDPAGLVNWKGTFGGLGYSIGGGGAVFGYQLTSECKCGQKVTITGFASALTAGISLKPGSVSGSGAEFYDYLDCPDPGIANGLFAMSSANVVIGTGPGYSRIQLGGLRSYLNLGDQNYGFDVSIGIYLGASAVTDAKVECCK